jgi:Ca2+-binding EF-hand superfamily protein
MRWRIVPVALAAALASFVALAADKPAGDKPADNKQPAAVADAQDVVFFSESRPVLIRLHVQVDNKPFEKVWEEYIAYIFKSIDANKDGVLSKEEAERAPLPQVLFGGGGFTGDFNTPSMELMDANKDGKVTLDELREYYRHNGGPPFQVQFGQNGANGLFTGAMLQGLSSGDVPSTDALNEALFTLLDTNKDGKLSKEELAAAPDVLQTLDSDDDEVISVQELLPTASPASYQIRRLSERLQSGDGENSAFMPITPGQPAPALARQLQARYGSKDSKNKGLTQKDLGLDKAAFDQLDNDHNGFLDGEELAHFAEKIPDVEITVRLGKTKAKEGIEIGTAGSLAASVKKQEGGAFFSMGNTRVDLKASGAAPRSQVDKVIRDSYKAQFKALDKDNNGYLDMNEVKGNPLFSSLFKLMDRDGDGKLYEKEMRAYLDELQDLQGKAMAGCVSLTIADQGRGLFDLLDTNKDGRLSVREMRNAFKLIAQLDQDGDGCISRGEIPRAYVLTARQGPPNAATLPSNIAVVQANMMAPAAPPNPGRGPLWFQKMDRNHDGDVSRREFLGTDEEFARLDTDGDGLISVEEAEQADARLRKPKTTSP